jgi:hypothetical protein
MWVQQPQVDLADGKSGLTLLTDLACRKESRARELVVPKS